MIDAIFQDGSDNAQVDETNSENVSSDVFILKLYIL